VSGGRYRRQTDHRESSVWSSTVTDIAEGFLHPAAFIYRNRSWRGSWEGVGGREDKNVAILTKIKRSGAVINL